MKQKRLYKISRGKIIDGVCGGFAEYFGLDPTLVRLIWAGFVLAGGSGIALYIVCMFIMPREPQDF